MGGSNIPTYKRLVFSTLLYSKKMSSFNFLEDVQFFSLNNYTPCIK